MSVDIEPGGRVSVKVTKSPTNEAAAKTLSRLFAKDPANRQARRQRKKLRQSATEHRKRGGRLWAVLPKAPRLGQPTAGAACTLLATPDVIADLRSVDRFVELSPAT